jgi:hypothetical protein
MLLPFDGNYHPMTILRSFNTHMLRQFYTFNKNVLNTIKNAYAIFLQL